MITFERTTPADAAALTGVQTRTFDDDARRFGGQDCGGPPGYDDVGWQLQIMQRGHYYKILCDGQIVGGIIVFNLGRGHYELGRIYLDPDYQDRGIGTQAMAFIEAAYPQAARWILDTPGWATRNQHFYEKLGYVRVREERSGGEVSICYEKRISRQPGR